MGPTLLDMVEKNPASRVPNSPYKTVAVSRMLLCLFDEIECEIAHWIELDEDIEIPYGSCPQKASTTFRRKSRRTQNLYRRRDKGK